MSRHNGGQHRAVFFSPKAKKGLERFSIAVVDADSEQGKKQIKTTSSFFFPCRHPRGAGFKTTSNRIFLFRDSLSMTTTYLVRSSSRGEREERGQAGGTKESTSTSTLPTLPTSTKPAVAVGIPADLQCRRRAGRRRAPPRLSRAGRRAFCRFLES